MKLLIKIISLDYFDMTATNHAYFVTMFGYTGISAISRNGDRWDSSSGLLLALTAFAFEH